MSTRLDQLLSMAADAFDDRRNPFETSSLVEHRVTLDECGDLSEHLAAVIRGYLAIPKGEQVKILAAGAFKSAGLNPQDALNALRMQEVTKALKNFNERK